MTILSKLPGGRILVESSVTGPPVGTDYDPANKPIITFTDLKRLDVVFDDIACPPVDNYLMKKFDENTPPRTVKVKLLGQDFTPSDGAQMREVLLADNINITSLTFTARAIGS